MYKRSWNKKEREQATHLNLAMKKVKPQLSSFSFLYFHSLRHLTLLISSCFVAATATYLFQKKVFYIYFIISQIL